MYFKEFLKPTRWKIFLFILLMIITSLYSCVHFFGNGCVQGCSLGNCQPCPLCLAKDILPFSLGLIIPNYLIACLLFYIIIKIRKKLKERLLWRIIFGILLALILLVVLFFILRNKAYENLDSNDCKSFNKRVNLQPGMTTCMAEPYLYINKKTRDCLYRGCGYDNPFTSPGEDWIRIQ